MNMFAPITVVAIAATLSGCAGMHDPMGGQRLTADYVVGGGKLNWGDRIIVAAKVFEQNDRMAVCGLWTVRDKQVVSIGMHDYFVESGIIRVNGENVVHNLTFMPELDYAENMIGEPTSCVVTNHAWRPAYDNAKVEVIFPRQFLGGGSMQDTKFVFHQAKVEDITQ